MRILKIIMIFILSILLNACSNEDKTKTAQQTDKKELLIYCGITMIKPLSEICSIIEQQENCTINITKGGSGNLLKAIIFNKKGDLYLPGSDSYYKKIEKENKDLITQKVHVGYNKATILVKKGNPKNIKGELNDLINTDYLVVIGNPDSGSIGKETKKILSKKGIFDQVISNSVQLTTDSKDLILVLKNDEADIVINWFATSIWAENKNYVQALPIKDEYAKKKQLVLGLLKYSKHPDIAKKIISLASSEQGKNIFNKYGLYDIK
jgi:molybdate transport system substrate-binding protein